MIARDPTAPLARLTRTQRAYLEAVCRAGRIKAAAAVVGRDPATVKDVLAAGYRRAGVTGLTQAAYLLGLEEGRRWRAERTPEGRGE